VLQRYNVNPTNVNVTGRNLAHGQRSTIERALLAADLTLGRVDLVKPTIKQAAHLVGVCPAYVAAAKAIAEDPDARAAVLAGRVPLIIAGWSLSDHYLCASAKEKTRLGRVAGAGTVWDEVVVPAL
jgi:hypothetical protein